MERLNVHCHHSAQRAIIQLPKTFGGQDCLKALGQTVMQLKLTSIKETINVMETWKHEVRFQVVVLFFFILTLNLPKTSREPVLLALPRSFSAKHVYLPSSARVTLRISRLPSSQMNTLWRKQSEIFKHLQIIEKEKRKELHEIKNSPQLEVQKSSACLYVQI